MPTTRLRSRTCATPSGEADRFHRLETRTRLSPHLSGPSAYPPGPSQPHEGSDRRVAALVTFLGGHGTFAKGGGGVSGSLARAHSAGSSSISSCPEMPIRPI